MVSQFYLPVAGGQERMVAELSRALRRRGHHVEIASTTPTPDVDDTQDAAHRIHTLVGRFPGLHADGGRRHVPPFPDPEAVLSLRGIIARARPDIIHAHDWMAFSLLGALPRPRPPLVMSLHDFSLVCADKRLFRFDELCAGPSLARCLPCSRHKYGPVKGTVTALALRPAAADLTRKVDMFLPVSDAVALRSGLGHGKRPYRVIPNFVRDEMCGAPPPAAPPAGLPDGPYIAFAGDATRHKGLHVLYAAYRALTSPPPLVIIGRGFDGEGLAAPPGVIELGRRSHDDVLAVLRGAQVSVVPSVWPEPFGIVAIEALAMGTPVVASRTGGLADVIEHDVSGLFVPPGDVPALTAALDRVTTSGDVLRRLTEGARARAETFTATRVVPQFEDAYSAAMGTGPDIHPAG